MKFSSFPSVLVVLVATARLPWSVGQTTYTGENTTLADAQAAAYQAKTTLDEYFNKRFDMLLAECNLEVAQAACTDATEAAIEAAALATKANNTYNQAVLQVAALGNGTDGAYNDAYLASIESDATPADQTWKLFRAKEAWDQAVVEKNAASAAKTDADTASGNATTAKNTACDYGTKTSANSTAYGNFATATSNVENNTIIPGTIYPKTLDFVYEDKDGDLIPDRFDACPFQAGLRRNSPAIPGPQDFCPSGCPELWDEANNEPLDSDGDGIPDCEDRCPKEAGIYYNHDDHLTDNGFSLEWNGCPDRDNDGIPDMFDACPDQAGNMTAVPCSSGCPGNSTDANLDSDLDGVIDCLDRCPNTYAVNTTDGCPDLDGDGVPDSIDYCIATPGSDSFAFNRKLEDNSAKDLTIMGCPDADGDLVPDAVDLCDSPCYPNQGVEESNGVKKNGDAVVDKTGCPLDSDDDGVFDGYDQCDGTAHSSKPADDRNAIVYTKEDTSNATLLGCAKDTDNDGVVDGIDQCPTEGGYIDVTGCPKDSDGDGVSDCVSTSTDSACHNTTVMPSASCCTVEFDNCNATARGATVYTNADDYTVAYPDLANPQNQIGCSVDSDGDNVHDGFDQCPGTSPTEINLATSDPSKMTIDMKGCPILSAEMWEATVVDVTTSESNSADPSIEMLFSVNADLYNVLAARQYETSQMTQVQIMDPTCQNTFGADVLPFTVNMNSKGNYTGNIPTEGFPITVKVDLNPDNTVGSPVWTTSAPYDVGTIDFCLNFAILSDTLEPVTFTELITTVMIDMTQGFSVIGTAVERNQAEEATELIDIEYPLDTCQCDSSNICVDDNNLDDSFLSQSDSLKLCIRFKDVNGLPPAYVQMTDVKTFSCSQGGLMITPIANFEREGDGGQLTSVTRTNTGDGTDVNDRMLTIDTRLPAAFFGPEERPVDCTGTIVYSFTEGAGITRNRRVLAEASVSTGTTTDSTVQRRAESLTEASSDFSINVMLAKLDDGKPSVGVIAAAAVGSVAIVSLVATVLFIKYRGGGNVFVRRKSSATTDSWSDKVITTEDGFRAEEGFAA